jgi:predicted ATPase/DNA-binding SARP family transcriptional activator
MMAASNPLMIRLFGVFAAALNGVALAPTWHNDRLLALLVLRRAAPTERAWLAATLWPEANEANVRFYLRRTLAALRLALGTQAGRLLSPTSHTLQLDLAGADCDLAAFDTALARGDRAALEEVIALYRGPLLEGWHEEWALLDRGIREQKYLDALEALVRDGLAGQNPAEAARHLRALLAIEPLRERAQRSLMEALAQMGDYAAVMQVYRNFRLLLHQELRGSPTSETTALYRRLRAAAGERTRSIPRSLTLSAPLLRRLPAPPSTFIGRETEREQVLSLLETTRLLTLTGTGGVGKTRLAIAVAEQVAEEYREGVCFVDLSALSNSDRVVQAVATALEVREERSRPLQETLLDSLQDRSLLLILDNCEHLTGACSALSEALLARCPHLRLLATSRQPLGMIGERTWRVPSLSLPEANELDWETEIEARAVLMDSEAIQLFVERAVSVQPAFRLARENLSSVAELCRLLDGIPRAMELAAAWVRVMPVAQTLSRLRGRLDLLQSQQPGRLPRQQTLRATLDWSYGLLEEREQRLLQQLSVFASGWTLEAAEAVGGDAGEASDEVLLGLAGLVDKSLVEYGEHLAGTGRYRLLETTRQYAREKLEARGEESAASARHANWFLRLSEEAASKLHGAIQNAWFARLGAEEDNLRVALAWSQQNALDKALRIAAALREYWKVRGHWGEARELFSRFLDNPQSMPPILRALAFLEAGWWAIYQEQDPESAQARFRQGLVIARKAADEENIPALLLPLGQIAYARGDFEQALLLLRESLERHYALGHLRESVFARNEMGQVAFLQEDTAAARAFYEESLAVARASGDGISIGHTLDKLGDMALSQQDYTSAHTFYAEKLVIYRTSGETQGIVYSLNDLGNVAYGKQDYAASSAYYEQALDAARQIASRQLEALCLHKLAQAAMSQKEYARGRFLCAQSLTLGQRSGDWGCIAASLRLFARLVSAEGLAENAARLLGAAQHVQEKIGTLIPHEERPVYDRFLAELRGGIEAQTFASAWAQGYAMTLEEALEYALCEQAGR